MMHNNYVNRFLARLLSPLIVLYVKARRYYTTDQFREALEDKTCFQVIIDADAKGGFCIVPRWFGDLITWAIENNAPLKGLY